MKEKVLGSIQRALLGRVTPSLRAVNANVYDNQITLYFYYDEEPSEEEQELASLADTEFIADFPRPNFNTECKVLTIKYPKPIPNAQLWAYHRFEEEP